MRLNIDVLYSKQLGVEWVPINELILFCINKSYILRM